MVLDAAINSDNSNIADGNCGIGNNIKHQAYYSMLKYSTSLTASCSVKHMVLQESTRKLGNQANKEGKTDVEKIGKS